jgi:hypothetical protein
VALGFSHASSAQRLVPRGTFRRDGIWCATSLGPPLSANCQLVWERSHIGSSSGVLPLVTLVQASYLPTSRVIELQTTKTCLRDDISHCYSGSSGLEAFRILLQRQVSKGDLHLGTFQHLATRRHFLSYLCNHLSKIRKVLKLWIGQTFPT